MKPRTRFTNDDIFKADRDARARPGDARRGSRWGKRDTSALKAFEQLQERLMLQADTGEVWD